MVYQKHKKEVLKVVDESKVLFSTLVDERITEMKKHKADLKKFIQRQKRTHDEEIIGMRKIKFHSIKIYDKL